MRKRLLIAMALVLIPALSWGQEKQFKRVMIFPFKTAAEGGEAKFSTELAAVLGGELAREGDIQVMSGAPYLAAVQTARVDPARMARLARRMELFAVVWGGLSKMDSGYSLDVSVAEADEKKRPRGFSAQGKDMEELIAKMRDVAAEIGKVVLKRPVIGSIKIEGNKRIQTDAILNKMELKQGSPFRRSAVGEEIREIYSLGYFDDVQIEAEENSEGKVNLRIMVKERPSIKEIAIDGNKVFTKGEILDALTTKSLTVASMEKIRQDMAKMKEMYEKKGYYGVKIDYAIDEISRTEAKLTFKIDEGDRSFLTSIVLEGNKQLPDKELKKILTLKEKSWFWWIDETGQFTQKGLEENRARLIAHYWNKGFINVQVGAPVMAIDGSRAKITFPIREGDRYQVRKLDVSGELIEPREKLLERLKTKPHTWFDRGQVAEDIQTLTKLYNNAGYAYADVQTLQNINDQHRFLDLNFKISQGDRVTIERIDVRGNERTREKVIRRGLAIGEGDLYSANQLDATKKNLEAMDFFEAVKIKTSPGSKPDLMNLEVDVLEKKTGSLAAGIGFSSQDGAMGNIDLKERNLFGLGIVTQIKGNLSGRRNSYEGSVSYPWLFDTPLTATLRGYRFTQREMRYVRESEGFGINFGYPVYGHWGLSTGFARDSSKLSGFDPQFARSVMRYYETFGGQATKFMNLSENSVSVALSRDTRTGAEIPNGGSQITIGTRLSGFGGDVSFARWYSDVTHYRPIVWKAILKAKVSGSALSEMSGMPIPFDRRILLGGIQSIRGYQHGEVGPRDRFGNILGGDRGLFANVEILFPVLEMLRLNGVFFADAGNAWNVADTPFMQSVKAGAGLGIRWVSPVGPIRIEYGWKINPEKGETPGAVAFAMGQLF